MEQGQGIVCCPLPGLLRCTKVGVSNSLLAIEAPGITFLSFLKWTFRNVSINITDEIFIAVFPLPLIVQRLLLKAQRLFLTETSSSACGTGQPRPFPPASPEELQHPLHPSSPVSQVWGSNVPSAANTIICIGTVPKALPFALCGAEGLSCTSALLALLAVIAPAQGLMLSCHVRAPFVKDS